MAADPSTSTKQEVEFPLPLYCLNMQISYHQQVFHPTDSIAVTPEIEAHTGDAREVICDATKNYNPDMLVLGSHGYRALKRVVLGNVSDYSIHHVQCPVVFVKPKKNKAH